MKKLPALNYKTVSSSVGCCHEKPSGKSEGQGGEAHERDRRKRRKGEKGEKRKKAKKGSREKAQHLFNHYY